MNLYEDKNSTDSDVSLSNASGPSREGIDQDVAQKVPMITRLHALSTNQVRGEEFETKEFGKVIILQVVPLYYRIFASKKEGGDMILQVLANRSTLELEVMGVRCPDGKEDEILEAIVSAVEKKKKEKSE